MKMLSLENICLRFGERTVFENLNLQLPDSHWCCIHTGVSDGGSSLLKISGAFLQPQSGRVRLAEKTANQYSDSELFDLVSLCQETQGFLSIFQNFNNIVLPIAYHRDFSAEKVMDDMEHFCNLLGLGDMLELEPQQLTDVEHRLFNLVRALIIKPKILLVDEIQSGLSLDFRKKVLDLLQEQKERYGMTILMTVSAGDDTTYADSVYTIKDHKLEKMS